MSLLKIENLEASVDSKKILNGVDLSVEKGEVLALLGPNGHGKSTLLNVLTGSPRYRVDSGKVTYKDENLLPMEADERSRKGIFMAFQNPPDVDGVVTMDFYKAAINARREKPVSLFTFYKETTSAYERVGLDSSMASRNLNEGYSGGEKKRNEILQMILLKPDLALLDEIDSGLDVDALSYIADVINRMKEEGTTFIVISHYDRLYDLIKADRTAVMVNGRIALEGDFSLAKRIAREGYSFIEDELGISLKKEENRSIGVCAAKVTG